MTRSDLILTAAKEAGKIIATTPPNKGNVIHKEGRGNYVTAADKASEAIIFTHIRENFPNDTVLSEETASQLTDKQLLTAENLWIIDPIDGTANYQHERKYSSVSIGYAEKGVLTLGVVFDPFRGELFTSEKGKGSFRNGKKLHVGQTKDLPLATLITDNSYDPEMTRLHLETFLKIHPSPWLQMKGSAALELCEVASGQADLFFGFCLHPWDDAAAILCITEAGGIVVNRAGKETNFLSSEIIAGNKTLVNEFIKNII